MPRINWSYCLLASSSNFCWRSGSLAASSANLSARSGRRLNSDHIRCEHIAARCATRHASSFFSLSARFALCSSMRFSRDTARFAAASAGDPGAPVGRVFVERRDFPGEEEKKRNEGTVSRRLYTTSEFVDASPTTASFTTASFTTVFFATVFFATAFFAAVSLTAATRSSRPAIVSSL
jgi:hypothetical protein